MKVSVYTRIRSGMLITAVANVYPPDTSVGETEPTVEDIEYIFCKGGKLRNPQLHEGDEERVTEALINEYYVLKPHPGGTMR